MIYWDYWDLGNIYRGSRKWDKRGLHLSELKNME